MWSVWFIVVLLSNLRARTKDKYRYCSQIWRILFFFFIQYISWLLVYTTKSKHNCEIHPFHSSNSIRTHPPRHPLLVLVPPHFEAHLIPILRSNTSSDEHLSTRQPPFLHPPAPRGALAPSKVVRPGAPSSILVPSSKARSP